MRSTPSTTPDTLSGARCVAWPAEHQQLSGQPDRTLRRRGDLADVPALRLRNSAALRQQIGVPEDRRQDVVEIVRHARGQLADGFHLLRLAQLLLHATPLGDVDGGHEQVGLVIERHAGEPARQPHIAIERRVEMRSRGPDAPSSSASSAISSKPDFCQDASSR